MSETTERQRKPRFNHVAMSVPAELLSAAGRAELLESTQYRRIKSNAPVSIDPDTQ